MPDEVRRDADRLTAAIIACPDGWITWLAVQADEAGRVELAESPNDSVLRKLRETA